MACRHVKKHLRRRHAGRSNSVKSSAEVILGGLIVGYGFRNFGVDNETLNGTHYARPIAAAAVGHFVRKKHPNVGNGMLGAAGMALAQEYDDRTNRYKSSESSDSLTGHPNGGKGDMSTQPQPPVQTAGFGWSNAGALAYPGSFDAGAFAPQVVQVPIPDFNASGYGDDSEDAGDYDDPSDAGSVAFGYRPRSGPSVTFSGF